MSFASAALGAAVETTLAKQWGADKANPNAKPKLTRPNGALWLRKYKILVTDKFQSTLPHGERRGFPFQRTHLRDDFNPRSRMGSDGIFAKLES